MKKKILICGVTGFLGRNIAEFYARKDDYEVFGTYHNSKPFENENIKFLKADLTNTVDVNNVIAGKDILIQAAATTSGAKDIVSKPYIHVTDNAVMNALLFRSALANNISHFIFPSCTIMYESGDMPVKETSLDLNKEIYPKYFGAAWTKIYNEKMCEFYSRIGETKYSVIRHSNIYGPYDKFDLEKSHVFGATVTKVMNAKDGGEIVVWGEGNEKRDLLYVDDMVNFIDLCLKKQTTKYEIFNAGCGKAFSVKYIVGKIISASGKKISIKHDLSKPSINTNLCLDTEKAKHFINWQPSTTLDDGIIKTIKWYRENILD